MTDTLAARAVRGLATLALSALLAACHPGHLVREDLPAPRDNEQATQSLAEEAQPVLVAEPVAEPKNVWRVRRKHLLEMHKWSVFGKLALKSDSDAWTATLHWKQEGDHYRIRLTGPFGSGGVQIEGDPGRVELRTADNQVFQATDPEDLLYQHVGWRVPLSGLRYWILGRVEPGVPVERVYIDVAGRVVRFDQDGWKVEYLDYRKVDELAMPKRASLENSRVTAKVLVSRWELGI